jgi:Secretion system C-terminal sorting domain
MKTFTKIFLASLMVVVYMTGYGATLKNKVNNEGAFIPKTPAAAATEGTMWTSKASYLLGRLAYKPSFEWNSMKSFSVNLALPKRTFNGFTANSSNAAMLGLNPLQASYKFDEGKLKPSLNAYPNPSKGKFIISLSQASGATYKISLSNTIGHVIKVIEVQPGYHSYTIDLSDKPAGVYFYSLSVNDKLVETKRLILQQ